MLYGMLGTRVPFYNISFLHFAIEIKNKEKICIFSESSKSSMRLANRGLATPAIYQRVTF